MISCEKAADICTRAQYNEASFTERMKLKFHLIFCKICAEYSKYNKTLTTLCSKARLKTLSEQEKLELKERMKSGL